MSGFSADWLALREPADHRARNKELLGRLAAELAGREQVSIVDLGCGAGSNLRAVAPALGPRQRWLLVDHDPALLNAARASLAAWADRAETVGDDLVLQLGERSLTVAFASADLARGASAVLTEKPDLVSAAALFDLVSMRWIEAFAEQVAESGAAFYTALTYDGAEAWTPPHPADAVILKAFQAHQAGDKGFGPAAGPEASAALAAAFSAQGYRVEQAQSPWRLGPENAALLEQLSRGVADAVRETGESPEGVIADWLSARSVGATAVIGHTDILALPPRR